MKPIPGAQVSLNPARNPGGGAVLLSSVSNFVTDSSGQVVVSGLASGDYVLRVQHESYLGQLSGIGVQLANSTVGVTLSAEQPEARVVFNLIAGASISG